MKVNKHTRFGTTTLAGLAFALVLFGCAEYDSAYYSERVTICHKGEKTLVIPESALSGHFSHGDDRGPCEESD